MAIQAFSTTTSAIDLSSVQSQIDEIKADQITVDYQAQIDASNLLISAQQSAIAANDAVDVAQAASIADKEDEGVAVLYRPPNKPKIREHNTCARKNY